MLASSFCNMQKLLCRSFDRLHVARGISTFEPLRFQMTVPLCAEPLKKKKRLDPAILKAREERKKKRLEKQIRRMEKNAKQLKPVEECEVPLEIVNNRAERARPRVKLSNDEMNAQVDLIKAWSKYRHKQSFRDLQMIDRIIGSQDWALDQLKAESPELYAAAILPDEGLLPFKCAGPTETPPIVGYDSPDGDFFDTSKKWDVAPSDLMVASRKGKRK
ncbi:ribosomal protein L40 [Nesidiocoris tenuis]|uniref:Large ribosomal subunit protein mL40 n=1 Tax=Nesidiocoris tenuis TaxID=355587 RepID=A0ABN7BE23_9HEMI|nr:ribosomal protein L40 [Nesidiocoris tenuis]